MCPTCDDIQQVIEIAHPSDLRKIIRSIRANLASGALIAEPPFDQLKEDGPWPDHLEHRFACAHCGQRFSLEAETYHGAGGQWRPIESQS